MNYKYQKLDGYRFFCEIFAIITLEKATKRMIEEKGNSPENSDNDDIVTDFLTERWSKYYDRVIIRERKTKEALLKHFEDYHARKNEDGSSLLETFYSDWKHTVNAIIKERKETRDPKVALGIAMTISLAMSNLNDGYFYIGEEEAKKILFLSLGIFGYQDIEFIPDTYFDEKENVRKLLFSALYSALLFLFPAKSGQTRTNNYNNGEQNIIHVVESDPESELFTAFSHVAESKSVAEQLWGSLNVDDLYLEFPNVQRLSMQDYYIVPDIVPEAQTDKRISVLTCERGQAIRSLVEGRSGCGKSTLAKMIAIICQNDVSAFANYDKAAKRLDFQRKMVPIIVSCKNLRMDDVKEGIIECGLRQMRDRANISGTCINQQHFIECEEYLITYCNHKIKQEELLLIIDDYSKIPGDCVDEFSRALKGLCAKPTLHVVVITDHLKPSAKLRLRDSFKGSYNEFRVKDLDIDAKYILSVLETWGAAGVRSVMPDAFAQIYVNTPRRLFRYAQALLKGETIHTVVEACLDEELDLRERYIDSRDEYFEFIREITLAALRERREEDRKQSRFTLNERQIRRVKNKNESWNDVWTCIETETILLEQCKKVNSMEFSTPLYLYSVLAEYYLEILQQNTSEQCAQKLLEACSCLSCMEFAYILGLLICRLYETRFETISDSNAEILIKTIVAKIFEVETVNDLEYVQWALSDIISEEHEVTFIHGGNAVRRKRIWHVLKRAFLSLNECKDILTENELLQP